jgi:pyruvate formate-lyase activating enzyme-like uncharacterized protein
MKKIKKTPYYSYKLGNLPKGCQLCVQGLKSVFFITGLCSSTCFFCPISDEKKNKDVVYINEWPTFEKKNILKEIQLCSSKGVGITGGDPLLKLDRTVNYIELFKKRLGKKFHIHIYLPLNHVNENNLNKLFDSGLDEIRFHPDLDDYKYWEKIKLAKNFDLDIGVEIPVIPNKEKQTKKLIDYIYNKVDFINLNELEFSDTNYNKILEHGYKAKDRISYAVQGSDMLAKKLMKYIFNNKYNLNVHYCTAKLKDKVQLGKRIKNRAKNIAEDYDILTNEGLLIRGAIYLKELIPGFEYRNKLKKLKNKKEIIKKLENIKKNLQEKFEIPDNLIGIDKVKLRILIEPVILREIYKKLNFKSAIVKEFPTYDMFEIEIEFLN